jgi:hypothetical protein
MADLSGFAYREVQFTKDGAVHDEGEVAALLDMLDAEDATDLVAISHGWNNEIQDARNLYAAFWASVRSLLDAGQGPALGNRRLAILGILWPAKKFADVEQIASGAAGLGDSADVDAEIADGLDLLASALASPTATRKLRRAKRLIPRLETDPAARRELADTIRSVLPKRAVNDEDASDDFFRLPGEEVIARLSKPMPLVTPPTGPADSGGATDIGDPVGPPPGFGGAASFGDLFSGIKAGAQRLVNYSTYFLMKGRAGTVGSTGLAPVLRRVHQRRPNLKIHLVGHSFGGRLVSAAAAASAEPPPLPITSMMLLQAAFSHHGFASHFDGTRDGFFRRAIGDHVISGPVLITHTPNDLAVGNLYPLASLLSGDDAAALGDANDPYGGIGRNGAQKTPEAVVSQLLEVGGAYQLDGGKLYNLEASAFIMNHGDITGQQVAHAFLCGLATT